MGIPINSFYLREITNTTALSFRNGKSSQGSWSIKLLRKLFPLQYVLFFTVLYIFEKSDMATPSFRRLQPTFHLVSHHKGLYRAAAEILTWSYQQHKENRLHFNFSPVFSKKSVVFIEDTHKASNRV